MERDTDLVVLQQLHDRVDAEIVRGALEAAGLPAGVLGDSTANALMGSPVSVVVRRCDLEQARAVLAGAADLPTPPAE